MKRILCTLFLATALLPAYSQFLPVVKTDRLWYNFFDGDLFDGTLILGVGSDTLINGKSLPTLVEKDQNLNTKQVLGTLEEDTSQGLLMVNLFGSISYRINFGASVGDSLPATTAMGATIYLSVDSIYTYTDFRGISRRVLVMGVPAQNFAQPRQIRFLEGLGPEGSLLNPNYDGSLSDISRHSLRCVFDANEKIYGDTIQQCFVLSNEQLARPELALYPNPAQDYLQWKSQWQPQQFSIYSIGGQVVKEGRLNQYDRVEVADLMPGLYFIKLNAKSDESIRLRFMKQ